LGLEARDLFKLRNFLPRISICNITASVFSFSIKFNCSLNINCVSSSATEPRAIDINCLNSALDLLECPSAIFDGMEIAHLLI
jgi:hypothetical protein